MVLTLVAALIGLRLAAQLLLNALNAAEVRRHAAVAPPQVAAIMDPATYARAVEYTLARNAVLFLFAWELMAVASFFLVTFEHERESVREAGWIYFVATHLGTAFLLMFFLLRRAMS